MGGEVGEKGQHKVVLADSHLIHFQQNDFYTVLATSGSRAESNGRRAQRVPALPWRSLSTLLRACFAASRELVLADLFHQLRVPHYLHALLPGFVLIFADNNSDETRRWSKCDP